MPPKVSPESADRHQRAAVAKNELVSQYLHLATNFKRCSAAVEAYAHALNEASDTKEIVDLLKAPLGRAMPTGFPDYLPFLHTEDPTAHTNSKKRGKTDEDDAAAESETEYDANGKKKRKKVAKKEKDPNAPKRPASAYIIFQNEIREKVKENNPGVPYSEILQQVAEQWKALGEEKQRVFKDRADAAMAAWRTTADAYTKHKEEDELANGDHSMAVDPTEAAAIQAALTAKPKKDKKAPASKKESKANATIATSTPAATGTTALPSAPVSKKESKKDAKAKAISAPSTATTSTPVVKNVALPKPASPVKASAAVPAKKNIPQTTQASSSEDSDSATSDDDSDSDDE